MTHSELCSTRPLRYTRALHAARLYGKVRRSAALVSLFVSGLFRDASACGESGKGRDFCSLPSPFFLFLFFRSEQGGQRVPTPVRMTTLTASGAPSSAGTGPRAWYRTSPRGACFVCLLTVCVVCVLFCYVLDPLFWSVSPRLVSPLASLWLRLAFSTV